MRVLLCGANGFIGSLFLESAPDWIGSCIDIADQRAVDAELDDHSPDLVINCAGKTGRPNIDWCESHRVETFRSNVTGPAVLVAECMKRDIRFVHIGSGCIFEGDNDGRGFSEDDPPNFAESFYSRTKYLADQILSEFPVLILRLRMPFDDSNNPRSLINRLRGYDRVLDEQNSLTYLPDFIDSAKRLIEMGATGIYHIVNPGAISPYQIMVRYKESVDPTHEFERLEVSHLSEVAAAPRSNCVLSTQKLQEAGINLRSIHDAIQSAFEVRSSKVTQPGIARSTT